MKKASQSFIKPANSPQQHFHNKKDHPQDKNNDGDPVDAMHHPNIYAGWVFTRFVFLKDTDEISKKFPELKNITHISSIFFLFYF